MGSGQAGVFSEGTEFHGSEKDRGDLLMDNGLQVTKNKQYFCQLTEIG